jgi:hypothetical protein
MLFAVSMALAIPSQIYVSASGKDSNSGRSWSSPFETLQKAVNAAKESPTTIHIRGAVRTAATVMVEGSNGLKIVGEKDASLLGSAQIAQWKEDHFNGIPVWSAPLPRSSAPYELFVGHSHLRAERARLPEKGFLHFATVSGSSKAPWNEGQQAATYNPRDLPDLSHPEDAEVVVHQLWVTSRLPLAHVDPSTHTFEFAKKSVFKLNDAHSDQPSNYYLDNVAEALKDPGQWYWSSSQSKIYYVPKPGETLKSFRAELPSLPTVLSVRHSSNLTIENLRISGSEFQYPAASSGDGQAAISVTAAVELADSQNCLLQNVSVSGAGTYGFEISGKSIGNRIERCQVSDVGAGGIKIGHGTSSTTVADCEFQHLGKIYPSAIGVWIGNSGHNRVTHCLIQDAGYSGISVGWSWGYGKSDAVDNLIDSNLIRDLGHGELSDMGGIYTLGVSPGTVLRHNRIDHVRCTYYGGWGIYLDEGSSHILAEDNLVTDCQTGNFHQHYGADNMIRNNIFAFAPTVAQIIRTRPEDHVSFTMEHNIFLWSGTPLFGGNLSGGGIVFRSNDFWSGDEPTKVPDFVAVHPRILGIVAEGGYNSFDASTNLNLPPSFINPTKGNFTFSRKESVYEIIRFKPFPLNDFGPTKR